MLSWQRAAFFLGAALVEATPLALLISLTGGMAWGALVAAVLAGALADWLVLRRLPPGRQGIGVVALGLLVAWWVVRGLVAPGAGPLEGWGQALVSTVALSDGRVVQAYFGLLAGLYCFWRGTRLTLHDTYTLHRLFRFASAALLLIVGLGFVGGRLGAEITAMAVDEVLVFFVVGLITIARASATEQRDAGLARLGWRGVATLLGAVALVMVLGLLIGSVFFEQIATVGKFFVAGVLLLFMLALSPFLLLIATALSWLFDQFDLAGRLGGFRPSAGIEAIQALQEQAEVQGNLPPWLVLIVQVLCGLVPVLLLLTLMLLARRRRLRRLNSDEERESLWSWGNLADDLRRLFDRRPATRIPGLRELLASLRGDDPASRIRRSYVRLLLLGEERQRPRAPQQTPREYAPIAGELGAGASAAALALTEAYERARYRPAGASPDDADAAERAWGEIERHS
jgi:hypothetical protein